MVSPDVTPEQGITRYEWDRTQGPAFVKNLRLSIFFPSLKNYDLYSQENMVYIIYYTDFKLKLCIMFFSLKN